MCVCVTTSVKNVTNSYHDADICIPSGRLIENRDYLNSLQVEGKHSHELCLMNPPDQNLAFHLAKHLAKTVVRC